MQTNSKEKLFPYEQDQSKRMCQTESTSHLRLMNLSKSTSKINSQKKEFTCEELQIGFKRCLVLKILAEIPQIGVLILIDIPIDLTGDDGDNHHAAQNQEKYRHPPVMPVFRSAVCFNNTEYTEDESPKHEDQGEDTGPLRIIPR